MLLKLIKAILIISLLTLINTIICFTVSGIVLLQLISLGCNLYLALAIAVLVAVAVYLHINFNHKLLSLIKENKNE